MKQWVLSILCLSVLLLLAACGSDPEPSPTPTAATQSTVAQEVATSEATPAAAATEASTGNVENGKQLFVAICSACHGPNGEGVKGLGKDMQQSEFISSLSDADLLAFLIKGRAVDDPLNTTGVIMPPKGGNPSLTDAQLLDIIAFIRSIHK